MDRSSFRGALPPAITFHAFGVMTRSTASSQKTGEAQLRKGKAFPYIRRQIRSGNCHQRRFAISMPQRQIKFGGHVAAAGGKFFEIEQLVIE
ncbi:MAG: hypothetical protein QOH71_1914 [Blastocatellia bacterium]|nr:hypothetical protein [Blastocatellia bacterium]